jgi:hypothetical protein
VRWHIDENEKLRMKMIRHNGHVVYIYGTFCLGVWNLSITYTRTVKVNMWLSYDNVEFIT